MLSLNEPNCSVVLESLILNIGDFDAFACTIPDRLFATSGLFADNLLRVTTPGGCQSIEQRQTVILSKDDGLKGGKKFMIWFNEAILGDFSDFWSKFSHFHLIIILDWPS